MVLNILTWKIFTMNVEYRLLLGVQKHPLLQYQKFSGKTNVEKQQPI